ncbi:MAG TPA: glutaminyl-peptide cyclotransferase [Hyphomonadaceae bacterium]|nr:glutaminyl-peptide cyclotransferase [Hyphomonadaceae bacterium]
MRTILLAFLVAASCSPKVADPAPPAAVAPAEAAVPLYTYKVVASYPHDTGAFTEGLFVQDGFLYEATGNVGESSIRKVELSTGKVLQKRDVPAPYFGEGIIAWKGQLYELTWQHQKGFKYDLATFAPKGEWTYPGEGWALTTDGQKIFMSDGTSEIRILNPDTLAETGRIKVTLSGAPVDQLNELEFIKGEIWANVWMTDRIVRIDPATGKVVGTVYLGGLLSEADRGKSQPDVLNGIAYDAAGDHIYVTGKNWPKLYEIKVEKSN